MNLVLAPLILILDNNDMSAGEPRLSRVIQKKPPYGRLLEEINANVRWLADFRRSVVLDFCCHAAAALFAVLTETARGAASSRTFFVSS
jgi:hypothetical protein